MYLNGTGKTKFGNIPKSLVELVYNCIWTTTIIPRTKFDEYIKIFPKTPDWNRR